MNTSPSSINDSTTTAANWSVIDITNDKDCWDSQESFKQRQSEIRLSAYKQLLKEAEAEPLTEEMLEKLL